MITIKEVPISILKWQQFGKASRTEDNLRLGVETYTRNNAIISSHDSFQQKK